MALAANFDKTRKDIEKKIADSGAIEAFVGAADLAVKKMREASADVSARASAIDPKALAGQAQARVASAPEQLKAFPAKAQATVAAAPEQLTKAQAKAQAVVGEAVASALTAYGDLTSRGNDLVGRVRRQKATEDLKAQASTTASHAKATATTAKKSAATTGSTAKSAAKKTTSTAKKSAAKTKTSAKSTTTSAKKTVSAAKQAASDAADKTGN
jgi:hypothetical protein